MSDILGNEKLNTEHPTIDNKGCCFDERTNQQIYSCKLSEDFSCIDGFTEDGIKAKYIFQEGRWFFGREIGYKNVIPMNQRPMEERQRIGRLGSDKVNGIREERKTLNQIAKELLDTDMSESAIDEVLGTSKQLLGDNKSSGAVMMVKMLQVAMSGSFKAAEFVRDTAGYKPKNEIEVNADIMTDADRSLMEKINNRLTG